MDGARAGKFQAEEMALWEKTIDSIQIKTASRVTAFKAKLKARYAEWAKGGVVKVTTTATLFLWNVQLCKKLLHSPQLCEELSSPSSQP